MLNNQTINIFLIFPTALVICTLSSNCLDNVGFMVIISFSENYELGHFGKSDRILSRGDKGSNVKIGDWLRDYVKITAISASQREIYTYFAKQIRP